MIFNVHLNLCLIYSNIIISKLKQLRNSIIILHLEQAQSLSHFTLALCYNFPTLQIFLFYIGNSAILINIFLIFLVPLLPTDVEGLGLLVFFFIFFALSSALVAGSTSGNFLLGMLPFGPRLGR